MKAMELKPAAELRQGKEWAGMESDIAKHEELLRRARELMSWEPEGREEDVSNVDKRYNDVVSTVKEINTLAEAVQKKVEAVERGEVQFYGWDPMQVAPKNKEQADDYYEERHSAQTFSWGIKGSSGPYRSEKI